MATLARPPFVARSCVRQAPGQAAWLARLHAQAAGHLDHLPWPSRRVAGWQYASLRGLEAADLPPSPGPGQVAAADLPAPLGHGPRLTFVDGHFVAALSSPARALPAGVWLGPLAAALAARLPGLEAQLGGRDLHQVEALAALNTAAFADAAVLHVAAAAQLAESIELVFVASAAATGHVAHPRLLVVAGPASVSTLVERHVSLATALQVTTPVAEFELGAAARLRLVRLATGGAGGYHLACGAARLGRDSALEVHLLGHGGAMVRQGMRVQLAEPGAHCALHGLMMAADDEHIDTQLVIEHRAAHTSSRQLFKALARGRGTTAFGGRVVVAPQALGSQAEQLCRSLLLSPQASAHAQPELEILTDDVRCTHGATVGNLDDTALFYLRSRGLDDARARALLTYAFADEVVAKFPAVARPAVAAAVASWLDVPGLAAGEAA